LQLAAGRSGKWPVQGHQQLQAPTGHWRAEKVKILARLQPTHGLRIKETSETAWEATGRI
jgi:hypothetical protein